MEENKTYFGETGDPAMEQAFLKAQQTFKYFWRELSWEFNRIVPALDLAVVKIAFMEATANPDTPHVEHMWVDEVGFDGDTISGTLINNPSTLRNVKNGDAIKVPLTQVSDWLFTSGGKTYGGFTIQHLRSKMDKKERKEHDEAWGFDFGDYDDILIVYKEKENPENLIEHPMSINTKESLIDFIMENPAELTNKDESGHTFLHREVISGNRTAVEVLLQAGADRNAVSNTGKKPLDLARQLNWEHIIPLLEN